MASPTDARCCLVGCFYSVLSPPDVCNDGDQILGDIPINSEQVIQQILSHRVRSVVKQTLVEAKSHAQVIPIAAVTLIEIAASLSLEKKYENTFLMGDTERTVWLLQRTQQISDALLDTLDDILDNMDCHN